MGYLIFPIAALSLYLAIQVGAVVLQTLRDGIDLVSGPDVD